MSAIERVAIIGGGVIGAGWVARFIENGIDVAIYDPAADAVVKVEAVLENSRYAYDKLIKVHRRQEGSVTFCHSLVDAASNAMEALGYEVKG